MQIINVSDILNEEPQIGSVNVKFIYTRKTGDFYRNRYLHGTFALTFVLSGKKEVFGQQGRVIVSAGQGLLIPHGNVIMTEHASGDGSFERLIILFPLSEISRFLTEKAISINSNVKLTGQPSFLHLTSDKFQEAYTNNIIVLINNYIDLDPVMSRHKLDEILLHIYQSAPSEFLGLIDCFLDLNSISLKTLVETNLMNNLSLQELAFLSNRSLSSFKRDFEREYLLSPQRYIRERKIQRAADELKKGKHPAEIYLEFGYTTLSNFNAAFKKQFGTSPGAYRSLSFPVN